MATNFTDHNGAVIQFVRAYLIFWGSAWTANPPPTPTVAQVTAGIRGILSGGYLTGLSQYRGIGQGYLLGSTTVTSSSPPAGFTDANVSTFIKGLISAGTIPDIDADNQTLYVVMMPKGVNASNSGFIGEHTYYTDAKNRRVRFAWVTNDGTLAHLTQIASHEIAEAMTDPEGSAILGDAGTCSGSGWCEIGDVCQGTDGTVNGVAVQSLWSQKDKACKVFDYPAQTYPYVGTQFTGSVAANASHRWFTFNWPAWQQIAWTVMPTTFGTAAQLSWKVEVQRAAGAFVTYWITVNNLTAAPVSFEGRYEVLGRWQ